MSRSEYPHKLDHVLEADADALPPRVLHPIFFGSFDWHSCVHGWWTLLTLRRLFPDIAEAPAIAELADATLHGRQGRGRARLSRPADQPRVRAALRLGAGCSTCTSKRRATRTATGPRELEPLARAFAERLRDLSRQC